MNKCASKVMEKMPDIVLAYGESDEYSFVISKKSNMYNRRESKIISLITSYFTSCYVYYWRDYLPDVEMQAIPAFDSRAVMYPSDKNLRDYLSWRQADCHINNLYNTCFWVLVKSGLSQKEAEKQLCGTLSRDKNELLFSKFGINYNNEPEIFKKGSVLVDVVNPQGNTTKRKKPRIAIQHCDIIRERFWREHPEILNPK
ncbi:tRNA-histidine guanylyltransferase 1-like [Spiromyces aspiralis]|uniref:tRNA-histidine guanylyltransferase 1-like n=1 Tax=Spiromyces aspiralis TaxID=68401 RepID=A0ACC1HGH6_9FUNG|nr:tRNA-histidine guanylyltransferase 1-like [Spiromyces aspiralis]